MSKRILIDLDNVVYPWAQHAATLLSFEGLTHYTVEELVQLYHNFEVWEDWGIPEGMFNWWWEQWIRRGLMYRGRVNEHLHFTALPGAIEGIWALSDDGWDIHLVTARLNKFRLHDQSVINTVEWLRDEGIPYRKISFTDDKHSILGDVIVDDQAHHLIDHPAPMRFLYPAAHNVMVRDPADGEYATLDEVRPWEDLVEVLTSGDS